MEKEVFVVYYHNSVRGVYYDEMDAMIRLFKELEGELENDELARLKEDMKGGLEVFRAGLNAVLGLEYDHDIFTTKLFVTED